MRDAVEYDALVLVTPPVFERLTGQYHNLTRFLPARNIYFLGSEEVGRLYREAVSDGRLFAGLSPQDADRLRFLCEEDVVPFADVHAVMTEVLAPVLKGQALPRGVTGWYYQQFLKLTYASMCEDDYYLVWDGDTIPCADFSMFAKGAAGSAPQAYFDVKQEFHAEYFETLGKLIPGMEKVIGPSFVAEHMIFKKDLVKKLLDRICANPDLTGETFWEKILRCVGSEKLMDSSFSEFETYGTFVALTAPMAYKLREWHSFRLGGEFFDPQTITDRDYAWLGRDFTAISFEKGHTVREDHKNLFDNPVYQEKLSAKQMLLIAQEEFQDGYRESWGEEGKAEAKAANSTSGAFGVEPGAAQGAAGSGMDSRDASVFQQSRLRYLQQGTWKEYERLGDLLIGQNDDQAYLCYENAEFLCDDPEAVKVVREKRLRLREQAKVNVRRACIVILSYNNRYLMEKCLESILTNCSTESASVVILDNGSTDGVAKWLETVRSDRVQVILSRENLGFAKGCNAAAAYAPAGEDIFLLNNDTRLPANALFWLRMGLYADGKVGATGALQNYTGAQLVDVKFDLPEQYMEFGAGFNRIPEDPQEVRAVDSLYTPMRKLSGFAMLIRRQLYDALHGFDEAFSPGYFEDDDLCERIRREGYSLLLCRNAFIYHAGSQSFAKREDLEALFAKNRKRFEEKWGYDSYTEDAFLSDMSPAGNAASADTADEDTEVELTKVKLMIWDLDNTFWNGTLSEGEVSPIAENLEFVRKSARCGIVHAICSKNDAEQALAKLSSSDFENIREYFVFPSIDWTPKAERIRGMLEDMALRPENVLFLDDEAFNLREARFVLPGLRTAGPEVLSELRTQLQSLPESDPQLKRREQYRILEQKAVDRTRAGSNLEFLRSSDIRLSLITDCMPHFDRVCELIARTNQLNYTKLRQTPEEVRTLLSDPDVGCVLVSAADRYGDYGIVGFVAGEKKAGGALIHFLFSCRTMGMGVEQYLYQKMGYPEIYIAEPVAVKLEKKEIVTWIREEAYTPGNDTQRADPEKLEQRTPEIAKPKVLLKGPCDIDGITPYLNAYMDIEMETNFVDNRGIVVAGSNHSLHLYELFHTPLEKIRETITASGFLCDADFMTYMFQDPYDAVVFSTLSDGHSGVYRDRETGVRICFGSCRFDLTSPVNWPGYLSGEYPGHGVDFTEETLERFAERFAFEGSQTPDQVVKSLRWMRRKLPEQTKLILLLGSEYEAQENTSEFAFHASIYRELNKALYEAFADAEDVWLLNISDYLVDQSSFVGCTNHFAKQVYHAVAEDLRGVIAPDLFGERTPEAQVRVAIILEILKEEEQRGIQGFCNLADDMDGLLDVCGQIEELLVKMSCGTATTEEEERYHSYGLSAIAENILLLNHSGRPALPPVKMRSGNMEAHQKYRTIYVLCPNLHKSGGPELLHQLVWQINEFGGCANLAFVMKHGDLYANPALVHYVKGHIVTQEEIEDSEDNAVIIPEGFPEAADKLQRIHKLFWWMSVDNYKRYYDFAPQPVEERMQRICAEMEYHLCQSFYAAEYVRSYGVPEDRILMLGDYLNDAYLNMPEPKRSGREDRILYNPIKDQMIGELMEAHPELPWTPIEKMTTDQVRELMCRSKVYIDFGMHPGKDRMPREAALCGCCVITGRRGSAAYFEDVSIPEEFRLDEQSVNVDGIIKRIVECLEHYETNSAKLDEYRIKIQNEKAEFESAVHDIFFL